MNGTSLPIRVLILVTLLAVPATALLGGDYFPPPESEGGWRQLDKPEDVRTIGGMDPERLEDLERWLLQSDDRDFAATVIRRGHVVLEVERGNSAKTDARRVASVSKAICASVLAIASERSRHGETPREMRFDDPAFQFIPWAQPLSDPRKKDIRVKQLLNHTSGLTPEASGARNKGPWKHVLGHDGDPNTVSLAFDPGTAAGYSTFGLYHAALVCENVTGKPYDEFAIEALFRPIGVEHWWFQHFDGGDGVEHWWFKHFDGGDKYGRHPSHAMGMPARDLARVAYCMLRHGRWKDRQVIPQWFVAETAQPTHDVKGVEMRFKINAETFSHGWELPARLTGANDTPSGEGIPDDARYKPGSGGQLIAFVPSLDLVISRQTGGSGAWEYTEYLRRACAAVLPDPVSESEPPHFGKWAPIELEFRGPESEGKGTPNPFAVSFEVMFTGPKGSLMRVPGFYDGDGEGGLDGSLWKVRFSAPVEGRWTYRTQSDVASLDGKTGAFVVDPVPEEAEGFWKWGRLEHPGTVENQLRYLKFRDGPHWLKAGCDDPENFLGNYENFDTLAKRKEAVDYLAGHGINSLYIMTHNIDGDDKDVWPWLGDTAEEAKSNGGGDARFDIAKLTEWRTLFEYMQVKGVVPYLILEDDSAWKGYDHDRYHREIIARFGDLPGLLFNLGEEHNENYTLDESLAMARRFKELDPYDHPLAIHNVNRPDKADAYIDSPALDATAIQTGQPGTRRGLEHATEHNQVAIDWIERCRERERRVLMVNFDEGRPELDRRAWWSAYMGGGVWEAHVTEPYDRPHSTWETTWKELGGTRAFMESMPFARMQPSKGMAFPRMQPHNDLVHSGNAFCLATPGRHYALYLPEGGEIEVILDGGFLYSSEWWNPSNGRDGKFQGRTILIGGGLRSFTAPGDGDWALRIVRRGRLD